MVAKRKEPLAGYKCVRCDQVIALEQVETIAIEAGTKGQSILIRYRCCQGRESMIGRYTYSSQLLGRITPKEPVRFPWHNPLRPRMSEVGIDKTVARWERLLAPIATATDLLEAIKKGHP